MSLRNNVLWVSLSLTSVNFDNLNNQTSADRPVDTVQNSVLIEMFPNIIFSDASGYDINLGLTSTKQYVSTQGYPNSYLHDQDCDFQFEVPPGEKIIVFIENIKLECGFDFIYLCGLLL